jgi:hypothetical protein
MTLQYLMKKAGVALMMLALPAFFCASAFAQIKVFERTQETDISKIGLYRDSESRLKISLNGEWEVSFNLGKSFQKVSVPLSYSFDENAIFRRKFSIPAEYLDKYSFIFVAEGIDYESDIKINGNFVATHIGGSAPIVTSVNDGIVAANNDILISVNSELNHSNTLPLSNQINYVTVNGGINKDIYLLAVPKLHVIKSIVKYSVDNVLSVKMMNVISIKSSNLSRFIGAGNDSAFSVKTVVLRKSTGEEAASSGALGFDIGENNSIRLENQLSIPNAILWTPEKPELYMLKTIIYSGKSVVDEFIQETGFTNFSLKGGEIFINGRQTRLKGINYFEDQPKGSTALSYELVEKDLSQIKSLGFNAIRVPGRSAHPYVVELSNKLGLLLMQEIPMNESADEYLEEEKYVRLMLNTLSDIVERDMNAPCVLAWGIGNDFDVSEKASLDYVKSAVSTIDSLNDRLTYYTSRTWNDDICSELVDFVGINFYGKKYDEIKTSVTELTNRQKPPSNRKNPNIFAARFGIRIDNSNSNGFSDIYSQEAQMKFMNECYPKIMQSTMGGFLSSFADWHSSNPLNFGLSEDPYLVTDGIHTYLREEKRSAGFVKRILLNEDLPRIQEGNFIPDFPYVFIIIGIAVMIILLYFLNRDKKLRSSMLRCLYKPTYFYSLVKDQMIISTGYNLLLALSISIGLSLYFSSILYFLKASNSLDMLLAKVFTNDSTKLLFSEIVNNKFYLISTVAIIQFLLITLTSFFLYFVSFYTRGKSFFKNIFTISVWSTLPMLIFLPIGTVIYKLSEGNSGYISITLWLFFILYVLYLNRILLGARSLFDIKTGKVYIYGLAIILIFYAGLYFYMWYFTGATETFDLIRNLTAR